MTSPPSQREIEWLARLLYERDAEHLVRVGWDQDNEAAKQGYRDEARAYLLRPGD